ncbi:hypothetical protein U91I_03838 [alpha proteobacterium U9-1i]|nr:hypothetical protein U91I_03838 [alpha proteobacterium U9-1i]
MARARILLVAVLFALAACGQQTGEKAGAPAADAPPDPFEMQIEIGRYGVMLDQVANLTTDIPSAAEPESEAPGTLARNLRHVVWEYNLNRSRLCARGLYPEVSCGPAYEPTWIADPATAEPSLEELRSRANAVSEQVMPFWETVCADIRARQTNDEERQYICAIE